MTYCPVSKLLFVSMIIQKLVISQISEHLHANNFYSCFQSAYWPRYSTQSQTAFFSSKFCNIYDESCETTFKAFAPYLIFSLCHMIIMPLPAPKIALQHFNYLFILHYKWLTVTHFSERTFNSFMFNVEEEEETNSLKTYNVKPSSKITQFFIYIPLTRNYRTPEARLGRKCSLLFHSSCSPNPTVAHKLATTEQKHWPHSGDERHPKRWFTKHGVYSKINYVLKERILCLSIC